MVPVGVFLRRRNGLDQDRRKAEGTVWSWWGYFFAEEMAWTRIGERPKAPYGPGGGISSQNRKSLHPDIDTNHEWQPIMAGRVE